MKKSILITLLCACMLGGYAQTQKGYVKTRGRLAANGSVIAGSRLSGATVSIRGGNNVVSGQNGAFSIKVPSGKFFVQNVQKQGYVVSDPDMLQRQYAFSDNDLILVMEDEQQRQNDRRAIERKVRNNLYAQLQKRSDEIEALKAQNKITEEKYRELMQKLNKDQDDNERIVKDMADRYTSLDFDQVDEFYHKMAYFIENGELTSADSLLRTKGDVRQQVEAQLERGAVIQAKEGELRKAKAVHQADKEELAQRCYSYYENFFMQHQNDSAAYYLELKASLDTTNVEWQNQAGFLIGKYLADYNKALTYYQRALRHSLAQFGEQSEWTGTTYNNIGSVYKDQGDYAKALEYHQQALTIRKSVFGENHPDVGESYNNIGYVYASQGDYTKALEYLQQDLAILKSVFGENHPNVATSYNNIGYVYASQGDYTKALEYHLRALAIQKSVFGENYPNVATNYNSISYVYASQGDYAKALEYHHLALTIQKSVYGENHPNVARSYNNIGSVYDSQGDYAKALEYFQHALAIWKSVFGENHPDVALSYNNIGSVYHKQGDYAKALEYYQQALAIRKSVYGENHPNTTITKNNIMLVEYDIALSGSKLDDYLSSHCFTATIVDGDTPARQQGMSAEYILLEFADWRQDRQMSLFKKNYELRGEPKDIVVMKNGVISSHHFEDKIGAQFSIKEITKEERQRIDAAYKEWKRNNR